MAFIHPQSCECTKSKLDLFVVPPTQTNIVSGNYVEYNPIATISQGTPIEFSITGGRAGLSGLGKHSAVCEGPNHNGNNVAVDNNDHVGPINLFLHILFSEVDINFKATLVTSSTD